MFTLPICTKIVGESVYHRRSQGQGGPHLTIPVARQPSFMVVTLGLLAVIVSLGMAFWLPGPARRVLASSALVTAVILTMPQLLLSYTLAPDGLTIRIVTGKKTITRDDVDSVAEVIRQRVLHPLK